MIDITNREPIDCFAIGEKHRCITTGERVGKACRTCCFYKPLWQADMVRIEEGDNVYLYTIEERSEMLYGKENSRY